MGCVLTMHHRRGTPSWLPRCGEGYAGRATIIGVPPRRLILCHSERSEESLARCAVSGVLVRAVGSMVRCLAIRRARRTPPRGSHKGVPLRGAFGVLRV